jgi:tetratricopeptide (TPR) repeat protein
VFEAAGSRAEAAGSLQAAIRAQPQEPELWHQHGLCLGRAKQFDAAVESLRRAAELRPKNDDYNKAVGFMLARMGRPDDALPWLTRAMPEADARYNLARMMQHIGREDDGQEQLSQALRADPNHLSALKMYTESQAISTPTPAPMAAEPVRAASFQDTDPPPPPRASTLPQRPATVEAPPAPRPAMPLIPVVSEHWDPKPAALPSLATPAPKVEPKPRTPATIGFEPNP